MPELNKKLLILLIITLIFLLVIFIALYNQDISAYIKASDEYRAGDYLSAAEQFSELSFLNSSYRARKSLYAAALSYENAGDLEAACKLYISLSDFKDSEARLAAIGPEYADWLEEEGDFLQSAYICNVLGLAERSNYLSARASLESKDYESAFNAFSGLGNYRNSGLYRRISLEGLYRLAQDKMEECEFDEAQRLFLLCGDYEHADKFMAYIELRKNMVYSGPDYFSNILPLNSLPKGELFACRDYFCYVPYKCDRDTKFCVYFAGGTGEPILQYQTVMEYFGNFTPNAIMLFCINSGFPFYEAKIQQSYEMLTELSLKYNLAIHDLSIVGSSLGCATALKAACRYYEDYNIVPLGLAALDNAMDWNLKCNLTQEERSTLAEAGSMCYLYEQSTELENPPMQELVDSGCNVVVIDCLDDDHNMISVYGFRLGCFDTVWTGRLDPSQYTAKYYLS